MAVLVLGLAFLSQRAPEAPPWAKDLPPLGGRTCGAWRGPGSYGKAPFASSRRRPLLQVRDPSIRPGLLA